jgi:hypothetical protein
MRRCLLVLVVLGLASQGTSSLGAEGENADGAAESGQQSGSAFMLGRVVDVETGRPVAGGIVEVQGKANIPRVLADASGQFLIRGLPAGTYRVIASATGYLPGGHGQTEPDGNVKPFEIDGSRSGYSIEIRLWRSGAIHGRVTDDTGNPLADIVVVATRLDPVPERRPARPASATTDDRGEYSLSGLRPGAYLVAARFGTRSILEPDPGSGPRRSGPGRGAPRVSGVRVGRAMVLLSAHPETGSTALATVTATGASVRKTTWFQHASDPVDAAPVRVLPGVTRLSLDIVVRTQPGVSVSGTISGMSPSSGSVTLRLDNRSGDDWLVDVSREVARSQSLPTGEFVLAGVPAGEYTLSAEQTRGTAGGRGFATARPPTPAMWGRVDLSVGTEDLSGITVSLRPGITLRGRVVSDQPGPGAATLGIAGVTVHSPAQPTGTAALGKDGTFTAGPMLPGLWTFRVRTAPGWMLGWIRMDGRTLTNRAIDIVDDVDEIELVITRRFGRIEGTLSGAATSGRPGVALMFPTDRSLWRDAAGSMLETREVRVGIDGRFAIEEVPAGEYFVTVASIDALDPRWRSAAVLAQLTSAALRISIGESETRTIEIARRWPK